MQNEQYPMPAMTEQKKALLIDFIRCVFDSMNGKEPENTQQHNENIEQCTKDVFEIALAAITAPPVQVLRPVELPHDDTKRMDWLVSKVVNVRTPLPYGSHDIFWSQQTSDDSDENYTTDLREKIDQIIATEVKE